MKKIQYSVYKRDTGNAGGKAKNDAFDILLRMGFKPSYKPSNFRAIRVIQQYFSLSKFNKKACVIIQYPAIHHKIMRKVVNIIDKAYYSVALIHDIESIQGTSDNLSCEIELLNHFNSLIVHNDKMRDFLVDNGCKCRMICLNIFDYLHDNSAPIMSYKKDRTIAFAGNLTKSKFLSQLKAVDSCIFNIYGGGADDDVLKQPNIKYMGLLPADEIVYKLEGDYGLVWDGDSVDECSGTAGGYLKYNNPHKMSLYLASGKPVIVWSKSAVAKFVADNGVGITVNSLNDLNNIDLNSRYEVMRANVQEIKKKLGEGYYLKTAINSVLREIK